MAHPVFQSVGVILQDFTSLLANLSIGQNYSELGGSDLG